MTRGANESKDPDSLDIYKSMVLYYIIYIDMGEKWGKKEL